MPALTPRHCPSRADAVFHPIEAVEIHLICGELVTSVSRPVAPEVPSATSCVVCPDADSACADGVILTAVYFSETPPETLKVAVPVTTVPEEE